LWGYEQWAFVNTGRFSEELSDWLHIKKDLEEFCIVGYNAVHFVES
jgi:hypothetical protein